MARYTTLVNWASELGMKRAGKLLSTNWAQEQATDQTLEALATGELNAAANNGTDDAERRSAKPVGKLKAGVK